MEGKKDIGKNTFKSQTLPVAGNDYNNNVDVC
jgi:hypothetical protein